MIRLKLAIWNSIVLVLVTCGLSYMIASMNRANLMSALDNELASRAKRISAAIAKFDPGSDQIRLPMDDQLPKSIAERGRTQLATMQQELFSPRLFNEKGEAEPIEGLSPWDKTALQQMLNDGRTEGFSTTRRVDVRSGADPIRLRVYTVRFTTGAKTAHFAQFASNLSAVESEVQRLNKTIVTVLPIAVVASILLGILLTTRALKPIKDVTASAMALRGLSMSDRLQVHGNDEIAKLSLLINECFDRNERSYERLLRFTSDAAHELRTPLTTILARAYVPDSGSMSTHDLERHLGTIYRVGQNMSKILDDLLLLARLDEGSKLILRPNVSVHDVIGNVSDRFIPILGDRLTVQLQDGLTVNGDALSLERLISNLVDNSIKHGSPETNIDVTGTIDGAFVKVEVSDRGPGIGPEYIDRVFDRFFQIDASRTSVDGIGGAGLGLNICRGIAHAHGGAISIASVLGEGTTVTLRIPRSGV